MFFIAVGTFQEYYQQDLLRGYSASTVSWIPSLQIFFIMGLVSLPVASNPFLVDRALANHNSQRAPSSASSTTAMVRGCCSWSAVSCTCSES